MREEFEVPSQLGQYVLRQQIGRGGMGEVWLAAKEGLGKPCVVKVLLPKYSQDQDYRRRFFREAKILARLRNGRIVPMIDYGEDGGRLYIVMEYIDGVALNTFCRALSDHGERLPVKVAAYIIGEVFEALRHAHERAPGGQPQGVIHRDVTPGNVLISSEGEVFLTDFGLARHEADFSKEVFGTLGYMAPEQALGSACFQSDLYGAGGLLFFMLTGLAPRRATNIEELIVNLYSVRAVTGRDDVAEPVQRLLTMCLAAEPSQRLGSARDGILLLDSWPSYRKETTVTAALYKSHVGPRRTGLTDIMPMAVEHPAPDAPGNTVRVDSPPKVVHSPGQASIEPRASSTVRLEEQPGPRRGAGLPPAPSASPPPQTPEEDKESLWKPWWNEPEPQRADEDADRANASEQGGTERYLPPLDQVEEDAPRIFRRPRRRRSPNNPDQAQSPPQAAPPSSSGRRRSDDGVGESASEADPRNTAEPAEPVSAVAQDATVKQVRAQGTKLLGALVFLAIGLAMGVVLVTSTSVAEPEPDGLRPSSSLARVLRAGGQPPLRTTDAEPRAMQ